MYQRNIIGAILFIHFRDQSVVFPMGHTKSQPVVGGRVMNKRDSVSAL